MTAEIIVWCLIAHRAIKHAATHSVFSRWVVVFAIALLGAAACTEPHSDDWLVSQAVLDARVRNPKLQPLVGATVDVRVFRSECVDSPYRLQRFTSSAAGTVRAVIDFDFASEDLGCVRVMITPPALSGLADTTVELTATFRAPATGVALDTARVDVVLRSQ
jgi:hypothetical protein